MVANKQNLVVTTASKQGEKRSIYSDFMCNNNELLQRMIWDPQDTSYMYYCYSRYATCAKANWSKCLGQSYRGIVYLGQHGP